MSLTAVSADNLPASPAVVRLTRTLIATALLAATLACIADAWDRVAEHPIGHAHALAHAAAAVFALCAGAAAWIGFRDRAGRDTSRRSVMNLLALGFAILWGGQAVGYALTAGTTGEFDGRIEQVPLLLSLPVLAVALLRICWPTGMTDADRRTAAIDSTVAVLGFAVVWWAGVVPHWVYPDPTSTQWERLDQVVMFGLGSVLLVIGVVSRRIGSLPFPQLALLMAGLAVQIASDTLGQVLLVADSESSITWSIVGYAVAAGLVVAFARRPAVEVETVSQRAAREFVSIATPLAVVLLAGILVIGQAVQAEAFGEAVGVLGVLTVIGLLAAVIVARVSSAYELRRVQEAGVAEVLAVRTREGWFRALVGDSADGVLVLDGDGRVLWTSPRFARDADFAVDPDGSWLFSDSLVDADASDVSLLLARVSTDPSQVGPYDLLVRGRAGATLEMEAMVRPISDIEFQGYVVTARDVSDARRLARQLANSRRRDELTGLLSREAFLSETATALEHASDAHQAVVVMLDLERFAALNDGLGHETGDQILVAVAASFDRLPDTVHAASRIGSDTFALLLVCEDPEPTLTEVVDQCRDGLRGLLLADGREIEIGFHAGYVVADAGSGLSAEWHVEAADLALARSRSSRQARLVGYHAAMRVETERRLRDEEMLRRAIAEDRIEVYYQPVQRLSDLVVTGSEALARLRDVDGRMVTPIEFIPLAEELGLIGDIGRVVLEKAVRSTARLASELGHPLHVAVNIAVDQLTPELVTLVSDTLAREGLPAAQLSLEITESTLADRSDRMQGVLADLRALGVTMALDDFGTGYSSLSYLSTIPVDALKIDKSFVSVMGSSRQSLMLARVVVQLATALDLHTIAEGVETVEQADLLRGMGCDYAQGYLWARPLPADAYEAYLRGPVTLLEVAEIV